MRHSITEASDADGASLRLLTGEREGLPRLSEYLLCYPINLGELVLELLETKIEVHRLRALIRSGLSAPLNEIAQRARVHLDVDEMAVPISAPVRCGFVRSLSSTDST